MPDSVAIALIGLIVVIVAHIVFIARWSGRIDVYIKANVEQMEKIEHEILRLREARHQADGTIQRHEGMLKELLRAHSFRPHLTELSQQGD